MNKSFHIAASLLAAMLLLGGESRAEEQTNPAVNEEYEMDSWTSAKEINTIEAYEVYLAEHPSGRHAKFAQAAMNKIKKAENPKGAEESAPARAKDAGDTASKQPVTAAPVAPSAPAEAPAASSVEPKAVPPAAAPAPATNPPSVAETAQKQ